LDLVLGIVIALGVTIAAVVAMLEVRRRAPRGGYFSDGDRAAGVFGVLATGFAVLLGFIVFLAFTSYDQARAGAETESRMVAQQFETAQLMPRSVRAELSGQLVCYARSVIADEWPAMRDGTIGDRLNPWGATMFREVRALEPRGTAESIAYDRWLEQTQDREEARQDRVHGAVGVIPVPIWIVLFLVAGVIFAYMLFFADAAERAVTQGMLMGSVALTITSLMLLLAALDQPFTGDVGGLEPVAMTRTLTIVDETASAAGVRLAVPCDASGARLPG
jgi:hypothetical protein